MSLLGVCDSVAMTTKYYPDVNDSSMDYEYYCSIQNEPSGTGFPPASKVCETRGCTSPRARMMMRMMMAHAVTSSVSDSARSTRRFR